MIRLWMKAVVWCATVMVMGACANAEAATLKSMALSHNGVGYSLSYYSNKTPTGGMPAIKRVIIAMPGAGRDSDAEFTTINQQLHNSGANIAEILLLVPKPYNDEDKNAGRVPANNPYWRGTGWIYGYDSIDGRQLSSFAMMDDLVAQLTTAGAYPNLTQLVLVGHSAGGQFFSRHAALTNMHASLRSSIRAKYVIANPGSHMYFSTDRAQGPANDGATAFSPYANTAACPNYNTYKYGLDNFSADQPFHYPVTMGADDLFRRFAARQMYYYQGTADTVRYWEGSNNPPDGNCGAVLSGDYRFARGVTNTRYQRFMAWKTGAATLDRLFRRVENIGHDTANMYRSACMSTAVFGAAVPMSPARAVCNDLN